MLRLTTLRLTSDGRLLGFDTGDWSMLLGGFVLAGLLALFVWSFGLGLFNRGSFVLGDLMGSPPAGANLPGDSKLIAKFPE
jgi:hypothetical protein